MMRRMLNARGSQLSRRVAASGMNYPPQKPAVSLFACSLASTVVASKLWSELSAIAGLLLLRRTDGHIRTPCRPVGTPDHRRGSSDRTSPGLRAAGVSDFFTADVTDGYAQI